MTTDNNTTSQPKNEVCPEAPNGEMHYAIDGKLTKVSVMPNESIIAHYVGECEHCGRVMHFTREFVCSEDYNADTLEEEHITGAQEFYLEG